MGIEAVAGFVSRVLTWLAAHPQTAVLLASSWSALGAWLRTEAANRWTVSNSPEHLIWNGVTKLNPFGKKAEGSPTMANIDKTLTVCQNTDDVLSIAEDAVSRALTGEKPQQVLSDELPKLLLAGGEASGIGAEFTADPVAFCRTVGARAGACVGYVLKKFTGPKPVAAPGK